MAELFRQKARELGLNDQEVEAFVAEMQGRQAERKTWQGTSPAWESLKSGNKNIADFVLGPLYDVPPEEQAIADYAREQDPTAFALGSLVNPVDAALTLNPFGAASLPIRAGIQAAGGALSGGLTAPEGERTEQATLGAMAGPVGEVLGTIGQRVMKNILNIGENAVTATGRDRELIQAAQDAGMRLTPGDVTGSDAMRQLEEFADNPISRGLRAKFHGNPDEVNQKALNRVVAQSFGIDAEEITPKVMSDGRKLIRQKFDDSIGQLGHIEIPQDMADMVDQFVTKSKSLGRYKGLEYGALSGAEAKQLRETLLEQANNPNIKADDALVLRDFVDELDIQIESQLGDEGKALYREAREQYRNLMTAEKAAARGTGVTTSGNVNAKSYRSAAAPDEVWVERRDVVMPETARMMDVIDAKTGPLNRAWGSSGSSERELMYNLLMGGGTLMNTAMLGTGPLIMGGLTSTKPVSTTGLMAALARAQAEAENYEE
jgi:hypothetical protein